jgi:hypothetical protein
MILLLGILHSCGERPDSIDPKDREINFDVGPKIETEYYLESITEQDCRDEMYTRWFKEGEFDSIIYHFESTSVDTNFYTQDHRQGVYNLSKMEVSGKPDLISLLKRHPDNLWNQDLEGEIYYTDELLDKIGPYELYSWIICMYMSNPRMTYKLQRHIQDWVLKSGDCVDRHSDLFWTIHANVDCRLFNDETDVWLDSIKVEYPYWSYLDTLSLYYGDTCEGWIDTVYALDGRKVIRNKYEDHY